MKEYIEKNKQTLEKAIRQLPGPTPPEQLWSGIAGHLDREREWRSALEQLPVYSPPARVWDQIEQGLSRKPGRSAVFRRLRSAPYRKWAAAVIVGLLMVGWWWNEAAKNAATVSISYAEEVVMPAVVRTDWEEEDEIMAMVLQQADRSRMADHEVIQRLKTEYRELTAARTEVTQIMERYGRDEDLLKEIARIERARSQIVKELAAWI